MFKEITQKGFMDSVVQVAGFVGGSMISGAAANALNLGSRELNQGIAAGIGVLGVTATKDKTNGEKFVKALAAGLAGKSAYDLAAGMLRKQVTVKEGDLSITDKMIQGALGLSAPADDQDWMPALAAGELPQEPILQLPKPGEQVEENEEENVVVALA